MAARSPRAAIRDRGVRQPSSSPDRVRPRRVTGGAGVVVKEIPNLSLIWQVLVKEMFGLKELSKIQPIVYGCVIVGCMGGM